MTMIRINLIAERKAGAPKAVKKSTGQASEIQENLILIVLVILAFGLSAYLWKSAKSKLRKIQSEVKAAEADFDKLKDWPKKKEEYELQRELLNEKIKRISELKDLREGPVKLLEDIYNVRPESVWLESVTQGYDKSELVATATGRMDPSLGQSIGNSNLVRVVGYASSQEAITQFANQFISMDNRYKETDLNQIVRVQGGDSLSYRFTLWFKIPGKELPVEEKASTKKKGRKKKR